MCLTSPNFYCAEKEFHEALDALLEVLDIKSPFFLVVQVQKKLLNTSYSFSVVAKYYAGHLYIYKTS